MIKTNKNIDYGAALEKITSEPFKPDFRSEQVKEMAGYSKALQDLNIYLQVITEYKPEKRFIDAVPLLDGISLASGKINALLEESKNDLPSHLFEGAGNKETN